MITFSFALLLLIIGYFTYGRYGNLYYVPCSHTTPAYTKRQCRLLPLPREGLHDQFLNMPVLGPIFGAIMAHNLV